tara:strand:+ start:188 stop:421 length:234 start_codon:yes stop_codon:yes gene_type:complete
MFSFFRRVFRPIGYIGQKLKSVFNIGRKADVRNTAGFVNLAPEGLRFRPQGQEVMLGKGQGFFPNYTEATKQFNYLV